MHFWILSQPQKKSQINSDLSHWCFFWCFLRQVLILLIFFLPALYYISSSLFLEFIVSTKSQTSAPMPWFYLSVLPAHSKSLLCERDWFQRTTVKTVAEMKWIKTMNRDPISPKQEHDTQIHGAWKKIHKCKYCFGCAAVAAGHKELHTIAQRAHWFMNSRVGATLISGKCLHVDLLILGIFFFFQLSHCFADANPVNSLGSSGAGINKLWTTATLLSCRGVYLSLCELKGR